MKVLSSRIIAVAAVIFLLSIFSGCEKKKVIQVQTVGISMPDTTHSRWTRDGNFMKEGLEKGSHKVDLQFADGKPETQISQIESMIDNGCTVLVISPIDGNSLSGVLEKAAQNEIIVISYERLIMNTENVQYYISFDGKMIGEVQANFIAKRFNFDSRTKNNPLTIEYFAGSPEDSNSRIVFFAFKDMLKKHIESGVLVTPSLQTDFNSCFTEDWSTSVAQERMEKLIEKCGYSPGKKKLDMVFASSDCLALGVIQALENSGYESKDFPCIIGLDCDLANVKKIIEGKQTMSVFSDTRILAEKACYIVNRIAYDELNEIQSRFTSFNGVKEVPSIYCKLSLVTKDNYQKILVDSGYYTEEQINH